MFGTGGAGPGARGGRSGAGVEGLDPGPPTAHYVDPDAASVDRFYKQAVGSPQKRRLPPRHRQSDRGDRNGGGGGDGTSGPRLSVRVPGEAAASPRPKTMADIIMEKEYEVPISPRTPAPAPQTLDDLVDRE